MLPYDRTSGNWNGSGGLSGFVRLGCPCDATGDACPALNAKTGDRRGVHARPVRHRTGELSASLVPGGVALTWTDLKNTKDQGLRGYQYSMECRR